MRRRGRTRTVLTRSHSSWRVCASLRTHIKQQQQQHNGNNSNINQSAANASFRSNSERLWHQTGAASLGLRAQSRTLRAQQRPKVCARASAWCGRRQLPASQWQARGAKTPALDLCVRLHARICKSRLARNSCAHIARKSHHHRRHLFPSCRRPIPDNAGCGKHQIVTIAEATLRKVVTACRLATSAKPSRRALKGDKKGHKEGRSRAFSI